MSRNAISTTGVSVNPAYSHVVRAGDLLVVSGQVALDEQGAVLGPGHPVAQTRQAFENLRRVLESAGASLADVVKLTIFVTDPDIRPAVSEIRNSLFDEPRPASTYLIVAGLADPAFLIEVEALAWLGS